MICYLYGGKDQTIHAFIVMKPIQLNIVLFSVKNLSNFGIILRNGCMRYLVFLINISEIDILFGLTDQKSNDIDAINFGILFGKKYIHDERKNEKRYSNNFHIFKK